MEMLPWRWRTNKQKVKTELVSHSTKDCVKADFRNTFTPFRVTAAWAFNCGQRFQASLFCCWLQINFLSRFASIVFGIFLVPAGRDLGHLYAFKLSFTPNLAFVFYLNHCKRSMQQSVIINCQVSSFPFSPLLVWFTTYPYLHQEESLDYVTKRKFLKLPEQHRSEDFIPF